MHALEFFFDYGSPYSYLASTQVEALAQRTGATLRWRPFLLGAVFKATGNAPPAGNLYKARYLYKDLQDWAKHYGLPPLVIPEGFPNDSLKADRLGLLAEEQGRLVAFTHAVYRLAFVEGRDIGSEQVLGEALAAAGMDPAASFARASSQELKDRLRQNTEEAIERGAYGSPVFFVGDELFFGNDRLHFVEAALKASGKLQGTKETNR
jgi:2-hydroxychromene-2-carboxylate isomerase